jgi:nucleoside-diphosphate-sugar epimerase
MNVLITGGAGGVGLSVCKAFLDDGFDVRVFDLDNRVNQRRVRTLGASTDTVWGDITQFESVRRAMDGVDAVVHLAGILQPLTEENPELAARVNVGGTQTIVSLVKESGKRIPFVFPSSVAVFGPRPDLTECIHCDKVACNPTTVYAKNKIQSENIIKESGIDYVILRLTAVPHLKFALSFIRKEMYSIPLKNRFEFCHPDDVAFAMLNAVKNFQLVKGRTLIIAGGPSQQMLYEDMLGAMLRKFGLPLPPEHKFTSEPFYLHWYDTSASQELLKFQRKTFTEYTREMSKQFPAAFTAFMRYFVGPVFGRAIVWLL